MRIVAKLPLAGLLLSALAFVSAPAGSAPAKDAPPFVPVYEEDFPDPFIVHHEGEFTAYSTNSAGTNLPMVSSRDLVTWKEVKDPAKPGKRLDGMPALAPWVQEGRTWAPEVMEIGGRWLLYYTARHRKKAVQCIGVAAAEGPRGPFRDSSEEPLVCQAQLGGTIDAHPFRDADGKLYLYYKNDGNSIGKKTHIWGQRLAASGTTVEGEPVQLLTNDQRWEAHVIEAPTMVRTQMGYTLFFSANHYGWEDQRLSPYAMGYARCSAALGPCTDGPENPILYSYNDRKAGCLSGPGHQMVFGADGRRFIAFHAWSATSGCRRADLGRYMYIAPLAWTAEGKPVIAPSLRPGSE